MNNLDALNKLKEYITGRVKEDCIINICYTKDKEPLLHVNAPNHIIVSAENGAYKFTSGAGSRFFYNDKFNFADVEKCADFIIEQANMSGEDINKIYNGIAGKLQEQ